MVNDSTSSSSESSSALSFMMSEAKEEEEQKQELSQLKPQQIEPLLQQNTPTDYMPNPQSLQGSSESSGKNAQ